MRSMPDDAPPLRSSADRLTEWVSACDDDINATHDALNRAVPRLWWPLTVPPVQRRLGAREHALYAVHAGLGLGAAALLTPRRTRSLVLVIGAAVAVGSWAAFTGAWDRRADQEDS